MIERKVTSHVGAEPAAVFEAIADLARYPGFLRIVLRAKPAGDDAWLVDIGARLGPLRRSKRLRMVRTELRAGEHCRFERSETAGADHSPWMLQATVAPAAGGADLTMELAYGGSLWLPGLEQVLDAEIRSAGRRLAQHLA